MIWIHLASYSHNSIHRSTGRAESRTLSESKCRRIYVLPEWNIVAARQRKKLTEMSHESMGIRFHWMSWLTVLNSKEISFIHSLEESSLLLALRLRHTSIDKAFVTNNTERHNCEGRHTTRMRSHMYDYNNPVILLGCNHIISYYHFYGNTTFQPQM